MPTKATAQNRLPKPTSPDRLGPARRQDAIASMVTERFDLVVVGGGITGVGCALDGASRGLRVALVEAHDFACGTSSRSSKLIHGGLRYLEMMDFGLVREALAERNLLLSHLAPHLVKPVPFLYPLTHRIWERAYVGIGLALYDAMGGARAVPRHRHLSRHRALEIAPGLDPKALVGAVQYYDGLEDDARYVTAVARTAASYGAVLATRVQVTGFLGGPERIAGVVARDLSTGRAIKIRSDAVVNATGVWMDETQRLAGIDAGFAVRASKGVHLVVPAERIDSRSGLILRTPTSVLFVIPWGKHWIVGTTDTDWTLGKDHPDATEADIDYLLGQVNSVLAKPLVRSDIQGVFAGLRPLVAGDSASPSKLSRTHVVRRSAPGLVSIAGGKFTTYRIMAKDAIDLACRDIARPIPPSETHTIPLVGAASFAEVAARREELAGVADLGPERIQHLLGRYGDRTGEVVALAADNPELARSIPGAEDYIGAEAVYAVTHEGALGIEDVLERRTRIAIETFDRGRAAAGAVAQLIAGPLGWNQASEAGEVAAYHARVEADLTAQRQRDDLSAQTARLGALVGPDQP